MRAKESHHRNCSSASHLMTPDAPFAVSRRQKFCCCGHSLMTILAVGDRPEQR